MFEQIFENVRQKSPLIHNITNYVTVNDCANILLACGGSPIMADEPEDAVEITALCGGLNINIGTLNQRTIPAMFVAGKRANELGHPVVLDPVGAGASTLRTVTAIRLLKEVTFTVIRSNISEFKALALGSGATKGVDADAADKVTEENLDGGDLSQRFRPAHRNSDCYYRSHRHRGRRETGVLYPQRPPGDVCHHRHRLPALRPDNSFRYCQSGPASGSCCRRRVRHGALRGARL